MRILDETVYVGPNLYARFPVLRLLVDLGVFEEWPSARLGAPFIDGLLAALPGLHDHGCSYRAPGGLARRLREDEGTWLGHILEHVALELQELAGAHVTFGKTRGAGPRGHYHVVYEYEQRDVGLRAGELALTLLMSLVPAALRPAGAVPDGFDFARERDEFIRWAQRRAFGPSTAALVAEAERRGIPWIRLDDASLVQLGHGRWQQRLQATITGRTPHIAVELASDKAATNRILAGLGLPVPEQRLVHSAEDAVRAAERLGYPVVVKPADANHGRGITIGLTDAEQVRAAFTRAREHARDVLVEQYVGGADHRMLVIGGRLVAVAQRVPGHVVGNGRHTIEALVEAVNHDPRRGVGHEKILTRLEFDAQAERLLAEQGYTRTSVPAAGARVFLRSTGNLSTGGTAIDLTDVVHPDNAAMAVRAVQAIGLDVGGVDFLTDDITRSYKEAGGAICEINAAPGFRMHIAPSEGRPRDPAGAVLDLLFPPGTPSRIPIVAVTGTNGKTTTARMLAHLCQLAGHTVGLTTTDGVYIAGQRTVVGDMTGPAATEMVLSDPAVDLAVLEIARGGLLRAGMGVPDCDVAAVLNVGPDHLGRLGVETLEQMAEVKRIPVEVAREAAVLNADDPRVLAMAPHVRARHLTLTTMDPGHQAVRRHIEAGGRAVVLEAGITGPVLTLYEHRAPVPLLHAHLVPATREGRARHQIANALAAAAMAHALGCSLDQIRHGLQTFDTTFYQAPGRGNLFTQHPFQVVLDYAHNAPAVAAMADYVDRVPVAGRRLVVLAAPGDRRDADIAAVARSAAGHFDHYVVRRDDDLRGRAPDEVPRLLRAALRAAGVPAPAIDVVPDERAAVAHALALARAGDLLLVLADDLTRSWNQIVEFRPTAAERRARARRPARTPPAPLELAHGMARGYVYDRHGIRRARGEEVGD
ncbi:MAG TPA: cyanophycin synthetase [Gemmatimonadales bacterium]|nr:cyanophycin synthetase [Gemmatimonadales bacterium]